MKITKNDVLFVFSLISAIWFACIGIIWVYWIAVIAYPFAAISIFLLKMMKEESLRTKIIKVILIIGLVTSLSALLFLLIYN